MCGKGQHGAPWGGAEGWLVGGSPLLNTNGDATPALTELERSVDADDGDALTTEMTCSGERGRGLEGGRAMTETEEGGDDNEDKRGEAKMSEGLQEEGGDDEGKQGEEEKNARAGDEDGVERRSEEEPTKDAKGDGG